MEWEPFFNGFFNSVNSFSFFKAKVRTSGINEYVLLPTKST